MKINLEVLNKMVWFSIKIGDKYEAKYTPLNPIKKEYESCDKEGNILKKVSGKFEKGHFINEKTGEIHDKAFKLIKGKASSGFTGKIAKLDVKEVKPSEVEDLLIEKEFLVDCPKLYDELIKENKSFISAGWFGNGYKAYKVYIEASKLYKGYCNMKCGTTSKSEIITDVIGELTESNRLKEKLAEVELTIQSVNKVNVEDLIQI